mmetsp:Transcript_24858/g.34099  ORF Transcript_24858/g.34099 Transcript_24858/m.34099 type:complete len:275 (+) Transcript_24858:514-1338(+)
MNSFLRSSFSFSNSPRRTSISNKILSFCCASLVLNSLRSLSNSAWRSTRCPSRSRSILCTFTAASASNVRRSSSSAAPFTSRSRPSSRSAAPKYQSSSSGIIPNSVSTSSRKVSLRYLNLDSITSLARRIQRSARAFVAAVTLAVSPCSSFMIGSLASSSAVGCTAPLAFFIFNSRNFCAYFSICLRASGLGKAPPSFLRAATSHLLIMRPSGEVRVTTTGSKSTMSSSSSEEISCGRVIRDGPGALLACSSRSCAILSSHMLQRVQYSAWALK